MSYKIKLKTAKNLDTAFIFVTGGVISSVGKGIATASIAALLKTRGIAVAAVKCDAYLNVDAGTIRPQEHGEVFVMKGGAETDQDLGNYERFLNEDQPDQAYVTNGQIYQKIIQKERNFEYEGEDVEVAVHVPEEIIRRLEEVALIKQAKVVICEIGGTVGEYQNMLFVEASRIMKYRHNRKVAHVHIGYLPTPPSVGEMKSKPVQNSVRQLIASGVQPDFILGRAEKPLDDRRRDTLAWMCNVPKHHIISAPDVNSIYQVPINFEKQNLTNEILKTLGLPLGKINGHFHEWQNLNRTIQRVSGQKDVIKIGVVGKYFETGSYKLSDVYVSVIEAIKHASWKIGKKAELYWISSLDIEKRGANTILKNMNAIVVPGGFGSRGTNGMLSAITFAREKNIPYLGLCYGMQMAVIEFARNVAKLKNANTTEVDKSTPEPVVHIMPEQAKKLLKKEYGGSMRLGEWECKLDPISKTARLYLQSQDRIHKQKLLIKERHRHRYEFNNDYKEMLTKAGLKISGTTPDGQLVEIIELPKHPFFIATQFHPEFLSRPFNPHPLFIGLLKAATPTKIR